MYPYSQVLQFRWSDIDQNRHLLHSVFYDFGSMQRVSCLAHMGLTTSKLEEMKIGPVAFREEGLFKREIRFEDKVTIHVELVSMRKDASRWTIRHNFIKEDGTLAAIVTIEGAWMDIEIRKLTAPGDFVASVFEAFPKPEGFQYSVPELKIPGGN
jgi:acyl-CoA thioester hydrolase